MLAQGRQISAFTIPIWAFTIARSRHSRWSETHTSAGAVVLAIPLAGETRHLLDARRLALMKRGA